MKAAPGQAVSISAQPISRSPTNKNSCAVCIKNAVDLCHCSSKCGATSGGTGPNSCILPPVQRLTNRLMVLLQPFSLGPGILLLSFLLLQEVLVGTKQRVGMQLQDYVFGLLGHPVGMLAPLVMSFLTLSTGET